jgi:Flp pilus assembly protein TadB
VRRSPFPIFPFAVPGLPLGLAAVAMFTHIRRQRRLERKLDDLTAAVEGLARRASEGPPLVEEVSTEDEAR